MSKTEEGLKEAFAGESQANRKYLAFAEQADKEGFPQIAKILELQLLLKQFMLIIILEFLEELNLQKKISEEL